MKFSEELGKYLNFQESNFTPNIVFTSDYKDEIKNDIK
jgi:hypothetical protein